MSFAPSRIRACLLGTVLTIFPLRLYAQTSPSIPIMITGPSALPEGAAGSFYSALFITASNGARPYVWSATNLPAGMVFRKGGALSGTPATPGVYTPTFTVTDANGVAASTSLPLTIDVPPPLALTTTSPLAFGVVGTDYPEQILDATGGSPPYSFSIVSGTLPPGLNLTRDFISGVPTVAGTFQIAAAVTDSAGTQVTAPLSLTITSIPIDVQLSAGSITFGLGVNATNLPPTRAITLQSNVIAQPLTYSMTVSPVVSWLTVTGGASTPGEIDVSIASPALALPVGTYQTTVTATCTSEGCVPRAHNVTVTLNVNPAPGRILVPTSLLSFAADPSTNLPLTQSIELKNPGGTAAAITSITCSAPWCSIGAYPASLGGGADIVVPVTVSPATLSPGFHQTSIGVQRAAGVVTVPVTLFIPKLPAINLTPAGVTFNLIAGGIATNSTGSFLVRATSGSFAWTATASSTPNWLVVNTPSGTAAPGQPSRAAFSVDSTIAATLAAQPYYGTIRISAAGTANSPEEIRVVLNVVGGVKPEPQPAGLLFAVAAGANPAPQTIELASTSIQGLKYQAAAATVSGGLWLTASPLSGATSAASPAMTTVSVDPLGLSPGVYHGSVDFAFATFGVRTTKVTLVVEPTPSAAAPQARAATTAACTPSTLVVNQTTLPGNFSVMASWPQPITATLINDCGMPVNNGLVVATFSNGDPPVNLDLIDAVNGVYGATWVPVNTGSQLTLSLRASAPGLPPLTFQLSGGVKNNPVPVLNPHGTANIFNPVAGAALAPGTLVSIYGTNLASQVFEASSFPLPPAANGTSVVIGGIAAPLYYAGPNQINAQIPFELDPNSQFQIVVNAAGALTMPDKIQMAPATPGVDALNDGTVVAFHSDGITLVTDASPAALGETIVLYTLGMGLTSSIVNDGSASPGSPLAQAQVPVAVTIDGVQAQVAYAGLTPGYAGLYQIDLVVPKTLAGGDPQLVVSQGGVATNLTSIPIQ